MKPLLAHGLVLALGLGAAASPALAQTPIELPAAPEAPAPTPSAPLPPEIAELRDQDARVLALGFRLVTGNARFCEHATASAGLLLHDMAAYGDGETLRALLGLEGDIGVQALVPDGPAMRAGLQVDDTVIAIGDMAIADIPVEGTKPWERIETIRARTERLLAETGSLPITVLRSGEPVPLTIVGVPACPSRFEIGEGSKAVADGHRVVIGPDFAGVDYPDPLLAAVLSHEFAHNLLQHRAWFDANGRKRKAVRLTEREADRLMPWLLANAGFRPEDASRFMERWGPRYGGWIFRARTHDGWDERVEFIEAEFPELKRVRAADGSVDWARHFRRESLPER
ncbi:M48 family metalloprotease [Alteriqipengyuania sp. 357]